MSQKAQIVSPGVLTYGSVELMLCDYYHAGEIVCVDERLRLEVVDSMEKADGIIILGKVARRQHAYPSCLCVLFTHYVRHPYLDIVDHQATFRQLHSPTASVRRAFEHAFMMDLIKRSVSSSLAYTPTLRYF